MWIKYVQSLSDTSGKLFLVVCFCLFSISVLGQDKCDKLYLISGRIYEDNPSVDKAYLLRFENNKLDTIGMLSGDSTSFRFIKAYHDLRKIVILKDGYIHNDEYVLEIISMDKPEEMNFKIKLGDGNGLFEKNLVKYQDSLYYIFDNVGKYRGVNIDTYGNLSFRDPSILKNAILKGVVGGLEDIKTFDYILLGHNAIGDSVFYSIGGKDYYYDLEIPDSLISVNKTFFATHINNDNYMVIWNESSDYKSIKRLGWSKILIYDKKTQNWDVVKLKGNIVNVQNFNFWISGWVTEGFDNSNSFVWESPVNNFSNKLFFCERSRELAVYLPGILFLYNVATKQYLEWSTGQGDSEILYVKNDEVYYRVNNKILKRSIICDNSTFLSEPEIIIEDDVLLGVHWFF